MGENLANKYRPTDFSSVFGHERYVKAFRNMLADDCLPNCILLAGPSGTGKTTLSRVIAASCLCLGQNMCGECKGCKSTQSINDGPNFTHVDGSTQASKDMVENHLGPFLNSSPIGGSRYKVCIADEAQALSQGAKNSLLTLTENLPKRSLFVMTTTDPEAVDVAIRTRCFKVYLPPLTRTQLIAGVVHAKPELKPYKEALSILAESASGSMREMWQLVQQMLSFKEPITPSLASWMTRKATWNDRKCLWTFLSVGQFKRAADKWDSLLNAGADPNRLGEQFFEDLLKISSNNPQDRDWISPIRTMSHAQIFGTSYAWKTALISCSESLKDISFEPKVPKLDDLQAVYEYLYN